MKNKQFKNIMFDLDGTLVFGDVEYFFELYISELTKKFKKVFGGDEKKFAESFDVALNTFTYNDGSATNGEVFYKTFSQLIGVDRESLKEFFDDFYQNEFKKTHMTYDPIPKMIECLNYLYEQGYKIVLATDSMFTREAVDFKLFDCGIDPNVFYHIVTIDNCSYSKMNENYYTELLKTCNMNADETLMVGNHAIKDLNAKKCGIKTILIEDYLLNKTNIKVKDLISVDEFHDYIFKNF